MPKRVILITGTPCVGKTTAANLLATKLDALYINLTDLAMSENLVLGKDKQRKTVIVDEGRLKRKIRKLVKETDKNDIIIDGHYAPSVVPRELASYVFVLRRDPVELKKMMEKCGYSERKLTENLASEILDVCLAEAMNVRGPAKICELDVTSKSPEKLLKEILAILHGSVKCRVGVVDWLGKLEAQGLTGEYLKI
jgi:adenylate kinase